MLLAFGAQGVWVCVIVVHCVSKLTNDLVLRASCVWNCLTVALCVSKLDGGASDSTWSPGPRRGRHKTHVWCFLFLFTGLGVCTVCAKPYNSCMFDARIVECFWFLRTRCVELCNFVFCASQLMNAPRVCAPSVWNCLAVALCDSKLGLSTWRLGPGK